MQLKIENRDNGVSVNHLQTTQNDKLILSKCKVTKITSELVSNVKSPQWKSLSAHHIGLIPRVSRISNKILLIIIIVGMIYYLNDNL